MPSVRLPCVNQRVAAHVMGRKLRVEIHVLGKDSRKLVRMLEKLEAPELTRIDRIVWYQQSI